MSVFVLGVRGGIKRRQLVAEQLAELRIPIVELDEQRLDDCELTFEDEKVISEMLTSAVVNVYSAALELVRDLPDRAARLCQKPT